MEKVIFVKPKDLLVIENENEIVLKKGFLHINEVTIDKTKSSREFIETFNKFNENGTLELENNYNNNLYNDFNQLLQFGLIELKANINSVIISNKQFFSQDELEQYKTDFIDIDTFFNKSDVDTIIKNKNPINLNSVYEKYNTMLSGYDNIYFVCDLKNISKLRAINRISKYLDVELTLGFYDYDSIYFTRIKHGYTGCFECLEKQIITKFNYNFNYYENKKSVYLNIDKNSPQLLLLKSLLYQDMKNILIYGSSSLLGHVIYYCLSSFEYSYNMNRRNVSCANCANINNAMFEQQNVQSINLIKEALVNGSI